MYLRISRRIAVAAVTLLAAMCSAVPGAHAGMSDVTLPQVVTFKDVATGFVVDGNFAGQAYTHPFNNGSFQKWVVRPSNYGAVTLKSVATGLCLDSNTARNVRTQPCNGGSFQKWVAVKSTGGSVFLRNVATGYFLDSNAGRDVYTHSYNGGAYQKWTPIRASL